MAAGGLGAFAMAAAAHAAEPGTDLPMETGKPPNLNAPSAASASSIEKKNIEIVKAFCAAWGEDPPDADNLVGQYLSEDCLVRFGETIAPVTGHDAAISLFQTFFSNGERYDLKILETFARGPLVVNSRIDSTVKGKRTTNPTPVFGVFVVKNGKIKEWSDYV